MVTGAGVWGGSAAVVSVDRDGSVGSVEAPLVTAGPIGTSGVPPSANWSRA